MRYAPILSNYISNGERCDLCVARKLLADMAGKNMCEGSIGSFRTPEGAIWTL